MMTGSGVVELGLRVWLLLTHRGRGCRFGTEGSGAGEGVAARFKRPASRTPLQRLLADEISLEARAEGSPR
jgi:hypothetical protein